MAEYEYYRRHAEIKGEKRTGGKLRELFDDCTQANPEIFSAPSLGEMQRLAELVESKQREFYASLHGVEIILDDSLHDNYWCIHAGKQVYDDIMKIINREKK